MEQVKEFFVEKLKVKVYKDRSLMGRAVAEDSAKNIREVLNSNDQINVLFASAPSQIDFLEEFIKMNNIEWKKINAFHMDEFIGLDYNSPASFGSYLNRNLGEIIDPKQFHYMNGKADSIINECERYSELLKTNPLDIAFMGIGENGHIAFNDPHIADFNDQKLVKVVEQLDPVCRQQQVNDGHFDTLDDVPKQAITVTIPALMSSKTAYVIVPGKLKAEIIKRTLEGPIDLSCPGSILRKHENATLFLDSDSASKLDTKILGGN